MTAARISATSAVSLLLGALLLSACNQTITIPNRAPAVVFDSLEADGDVVDVYYRLLDLDGDDVAVEISVCAGASCLTPTAAPGGDGVENLPSEADATVLHLFRWAAGCDLQESEFGNELVVRIVPDDGDDVGPLAQSAVFTLAELGLTAECTPLE